MRDFGVNKNDMNKFAKKLSVLKISGREAAVRLGCAESSVSAYKNGSTSPPDGWELSLKGYPSREVIVRRIEAKIAAAEKLLPKYEDVNNTENTTLYIAKFAELEMLKNLLEK